MKSKEKSKEKYKNQRASRVRALIIVDQTPIRAKLIKQAQSWLKKIEATEKAAQTFQDVDLKLYTDWYNLTFNPLIQSIEADRREYLKLADFHNLMVAVSKEKNISMPAAYNFLKEEEGRYQNGDAEVRAAIDLLRAKRRKQVEEEMAQPEGECDCELCRRSRDQDDSDTEDLNKTAFENMKTEEEQIEKAREKFKSQILYYEGLTDKKLTKIMRDFSAALEFLNDAIPILLQASRADILRRFWKMAPLPLKTFLNKQAKTDFGLSFDAIMDDLEERDQIRERFGAADFDAQDFDDDFFAGPDFPKAKQKKDLDEGDRLRVKSLFRKIVRRIHPDNFNLEVSAELKSWFHLIWQQTAKAHEEENLEKLTVLHHKVLIALNEYDELGVSDLHSAAHSLESEHQSLLAERGSLTENPAWNFSKLKDYKKLKNKLSKPYLQQQKELKADVQRLTEQRAEIEKVAQMIQDGRLKPRPAKASSRRKKSHGRRRVSARQVKDDAQMGFGID